MRFRCLLAALFGVWFVFAPWVIGYTDLPSVVRASVVLGAVQVICSIWALKTNEASLPHWITMITGLTFAIAPFIISSLEISKVLLLSPFGLMTLFLSFSSLESK